MIRYAILFTALVSATACGGKDQPVAPTPTPTAAPATAIATDTIAGAYEALRVALVHDDLAAAKQSAVALAKVAGADEAIARAAHALGTAADIEAARLAFGDASRAYIERLAKDPEQAAGKHAFRCPMAKGYKKWVQLTGEIENPYMGQRMLECGGPVEMAP